MRLRTPSFWYDTSTTKARAAAAALSTLSGLYAIGHMAHQHAGRAGKVGIPVICIGNLVAGGGGKTPGAQAVMALVRSHGAANNPCFLSRGYGGALRGPVAVEPDRHRAADVGDEPLLLSTLAPTIISANRLDGARFAEARGHDLIIMDDGLQNTSLHKDVSVVVVDGPSGFGNEMLLPAGPLRTPVWRGLRQADAVVIIGADDHGVAERVPAGTPVLRAEIAPRGPAAPAAAYTGFCGIARPDKFRRSLDEAGLKIVDFLNFPDHYPYQDADLAMLRTVADRHASKLITTAKDAVRLPPAFEAGRDFDILDISLQWSSPAPETLLARLR